MSAKIPWKVILYILGAVGGVFGISLGGNFTADQLDTGSQKVIIQDGMQTKEVTKDEAMYHLMDKMYKGQTVIAGDVKVIKEDVAELDKKVEDNTKANKENAKDIEALKGKDK